MGGIELDLTDVSLSSRVVELELVAVMGVVEVRVPANIVVELVDAAVTWSVENATSRVAAASAPRGTVRIRGRSVLGRVHLRLEGLRAEPFVNASGMGLAPAG